MMSMDGSEATTITNKICNRCGGTAIYWPNAIVPGDPRAPRGSHRAVAHYQPAWTCASCGHIEPHERRAHSHGEPRRQIWRM